MIISVLVPLIRVPSIGWHCGDIELAAYRANAAGPLPLVLDLLIVHDRFGSRSDPSLNGHLHYPNDIDKSLNEAAADKTRKYRADYDNDPPTTVSFIPDVASTSGRLHSEFVRLLFLQTHRETDRFFAASGVQLAQTDRGQFHFRRAVFSSQLKSRVGLVLGCSFTCSLRVNLNIDGAPITSKSHTHPSHFANFSSKNLVFIFRCSSSPSNPVYVSRVDYSDLVFRLYHTDIQK